MANYVECLLEWSQWSCVKGCAGALNVLQSWLCSCEIRSAVYCPAPKLASPSMGGWSSLWYGSLGIAWGFPSLVVVSLVICSTPLATYSVPKYSDIELLVLSLFVPPIYLSVQRGCRPFQATCLFLLLLLLPLQCRRTLLTFIGGPVGL